VIWIDLTEAPLHFSYEQVDGAQEKYHADHIHQAALAEIAELRGLVDGMESALDQILEDGNFIKGYDKDKKPIFLEFSEISGGGAFLRRIWYIRH
jgi:hypothetical protein